MTNAINMVDPAGEYRLLRADIDAAVARVLASGRYVLGPEGEALEKELAGYTGAAHAVGVNSGTDALHLALVAGIREAPAAERIASSVFYPMPLHRQPANAEANAGLSLPAAEEAARTVLSLPIHPLLEDADVARIAAIVRAAA